MDEPEFKKILASFEDRSELFDEHDIHSDLRHLSAKATGDIPRDFLAELMAFGFAEDYQDSDTAWGTYYGPLMVMRNEEGKLMESPSIKLVDDDMLSYWAQRAVQSKHPILKARYADLVWDFSRHVTEKMADPAMARIVITANVEIAQRCLYEHDFDLAGKLKRALSLALQINDAELLQKVKETIISSEAHFAAKGNFKHRGFSYDLLVENNRIQLTDSESREILLALEQWLDIVSNAGNQDLFDPFAAEEAALRLAKYYRRIKDPDKMRTALLKYGNAFLEPAKTASALVSSAWLQKVYATYLQFNLKTEADAIAVELRTVGAKTKDEMVAMSGEVKISKEKLDEYITEMTDGDLEESLSRIASHFLPDRDEVTTQVREQSKKTVLQFLMTQSIQDHKGRPIAKIGPLHEDLDGHVVLHMSRNMSFETIFLRLVFERLQSKFNLSPKDLTDFLYKSPLFETDRLPIMSAGLQAFLEGNHIVTAHLLIPQIEDALRNLVEMAGGAIYKPNRSGGLSLKTLDEVLRDDIVTHVLDENTAFYLRVLLTDQRGWNIRNTVCHGLASAGYFTADMSDRILHALLLLGHIRPRDNKDADTS
ncbi:MAG: DUF4209 domain-containing protein [Nitrospirae bacterium]|nr:DUF4209 domain-containing protein [Nitrospirota bacterium]